MSGVSVIIEDLKKHPKCAHGPTLLFRTLDNFKPRNFYGCSAVRDRKQCSIFVWQDDTKAYRKRYWDQQIEKTMATAGPRTVYQTYMDMLQTCEAQRMYCHDCGEFRLPKQQEPHLAHNHVKGIKEDDFKAPSKFLRPLEDSKKEAQYLFSDNACEFIVDTIMKLGFKYVLCIGAPRIHEYILNNCMLKLDTFLMDFDKRYMAFNNPMQFAWYNMFNHHFFFEEGKENYQEFLKNNKGNELIIITDPPFGGRVEPLAATLKTINKEHLHLTKIQEKLPTFFVFPYYMEPNIKNEKSMKDFVMLDYKVGYDNHPLFSDGPKGRKQGSPVRIFTNVRPSLVALPESEGYRYCKICERWVSEENRHCDKCKSCTAKDGREYVHCDLCKRCVKDTWKHCAKCNKCALSDHTCELINFKNQCFHCKEVGHKKQNCPLMKEQKSNEKIAENAIKNNAKNATKQKREASVEESDEEVVIPVKKKKLKTKGSENGVTVPEHGEGTILTNADDVQRKKKKARNNNKDMTTNEKKNISPVGKKNNQKRRASLSVEESGEEVVRPTKKKLQKRNVENGDIGETALDEVRSTKKKMKGKKNMLKTEKKNNQKVQPSLPVEENCVEVISPVKQKKLKKKSIENGRDNEENVLNEVQSMKKKVKLNNKSEPLKATITNKQNGNEAKNTMKTDKKFAGKQAKVEKNQGKQKNTQKK